MCLLPVGVAHMLNMCATQFFEHQTAIQHSHRIADRHFCRLTLYPELFDAEIIPHTRCNMADYREFSLTARGFEFSTQGYPFIRLLQFQGGGNVFAIRTE